MTPVTEKMETRTSYPSKRPSKEEKITEMVHGRLTYLVENAKNSKTEEDKLRRQTRYAIKEGESGGKVGSPMINSTSPFELNLEDPIKLREIEQSAGNQIVGMATTQNGQFSNEDTYRVATLKVKDEVIEFYGVLDGHKGEETAGFVAENFPTTLQTILSEAETISFKTVTNALAEAIVKCDTTCQSKKGGTAATFLLRFRGPPLHDHLLIANVGDCRAILVKEGEKDPVYQLTEDASLKKERFVRSLEKFGFYIDKEKGRVNGFNVARDIGERLPAQPKITHVCPKDTAHHPEKGMISWEVLNYIVLATDGLWCAATSTEARDAVIAMHAKKMGPEEMAVRLMQGAEETGATDNITVMVIKLSQETQQDDFKPIF